MRTREAEYVLCSGFETHFSRDVMAAIAQLTPELAKRPIKIVPTVKESPTKPGDGSRGHQPVYANCISATGSTIRTFQMKQDFTAFELFGKAIAVLSSKSEFQGVQRVMFQKVLAPSHATMHENLSQFKLLQRIRLNRWIGKLSASNMVSCPEP